MSNEIYNIITEADKLRSEIVLCLEGAPGIGKTQAVYQWAKDHGRNVVEIIASQILPNEVSGITMPVNETHSMEVFDHARLSSLKDGDILFFDELLQAAPTTLSACLTLIQERRLMSGKMLPDILIIAATNPLASPTMVPLAIRQRFMFYHCKWNTAQWKKYIKDTLGIKVTSELTRKIAFDGDGYNVLTPRSATKLLTWMKNAESKEVVKQAISNMYTPLIAEAIERCTIVRTQEEQVKRIMDIASDVCMSDTIIDIDSDDDIATIMNKLIKLTEWPIIMARLEAEEA